MFVVSDSNANRAYGTSRGFQLRACKAAWSADACSSVSLQVWMVSGFTARKINRKGTQRTQRIYAIVTMRGQPWLDSNTVRSDMKLFSAERGCLTRSTSPDLTTWD